MRYKAFSKMLSCWTIWVTLGASLGLGQYQSGKYPAPIYPKVPKDLTVDDIMPIARKIVQGSDRGFGGHLFVPGYGVKAGERVLIVATPDHDKRVLEAIQRAIREAGATSDLLLGGTPYPGGRGEDEFKYLTNFNDFYPVSSGGLVHQTLVALAIAGNYNLAVSGDWGGVPRLPEGTKLRWRNIPWMFVDQFYLDGVGLDPALLQTIDDATWKLLTTAVKVHAFDPEGTDLTWETPPSYWEGPHSGGHLEILGEWTGRKHLKFPDGGATGVVAGTWDHAGPFPAVRVTVKNDKVTKIEGGGAYGQKWREMVEQYKDLNWPTKQGPGQFCWLFESALGTNPKWFRPKDTLDHGMGNWGERLRTGVVHWGFGAGSHDADSWGAPERGTSQTAKYYQAHPDTPTGHVHIHNYFLTVVLTDANGKETKLVDRGHLTLLDDPKVREAAAKYGDPNEVLRESWVPAIPGINVPGNYADYAKDPAAYVRKDLPNWGY
jgi:hypothetical protein